MRDICQISYTLPINTVEKKRWFISSCASLNVYAQGRTAQEAEVNLHDALTVFIEDCHERGTLDSVLQASGFKVANQLSNNGTALMVNSSVAAKLLRVPIEFHC